MTTRSLKYRTARSQRAEIRKPSADPSTAAGQFDLDHWLPHQFSFIANRVSAKLAQMYTERFGMSVIGWRIVAVLGRRAPLSAKEVAEYIGMDQVTVTRALAQLVALRLVSRRTDQTDRRKAVLRLTKYGAAAYDEIYPLALAIERELTERLLPQDLRRLHKVVNELVRRASEILGDDRSWRDFL